MSDVLELLREDADAVERRWRDNLWWWRSLSWALILAMATSFIAAAQLLVDVRFGTRVGERGCDAAPLGPLVLIAMAGAFAMLAATCNERGRYGARVVSASRATAGPLVLVVIILGLTLPGTLGCQSAATVSDLPLLGPALVGTGGLLVCAAACMLLGALLGRGVIVERGALDSDDLSAAARPTIVDQAIAEAEALQRDETATRFRGVDDEQ